MTSTRLHALDAIRGAALMLGLVIHGSMSFLPGLEQYGFPLSDNSKSLFLTWLFFILHMFRMAVFFLIAGLFAHLALARKGPKAFLKNRLQRIALPMVVASVISLVLIVPIILWAASKHYGADGLERLAAAQELAPAAPLTMHFWFLYYLLWFCFLATLGSILLQKLDPPGRVAAAVTRAIHALCRSRLLLLVTSAISAAMFYGRDNWIYWGGVPTPTEAVWREAPALVIYGMAFMLGWFFDRERDCLALMQAHWLHYFILALGLSGYSLVLVNPEPFSLPGSGATDKLHFAVVYAGASWCWIFAFIGAGMQFFSKENTTRRYVADASYWVYIIHLPIIFFLQALLMDVPLHWLIKFPVVLLVTAAISFWTYEHWVRYTFIGNTLNGRRERPTPGGDKAATSLH